MSTPTRHHIEKWAASLFAGFTLSVAGFCAPSAHAGFIGGGGKAAADCYAGLDISGVDDTSGSKIECTEGDACDASPCDDGKCTFEVSVCVNRSGISGCTPPAGGLASMKAAGPLGSGVPSDLTDEGCGDDVTFDLKLKNNGQKKNKRVIRSRATAADSAQPRKDQDSFTFVCLPRSSECSASPSGAFVR